MGFEPTDNGFAIHSDRDVSTANAESCESCPATLAPDLRFDPEEHPDLAAVVEAWADLPAALRAGIVAMVLATGNGGGK